MGRVGWVVGLIAVLLIVLLRVVSLESDAYPRLSWSSGLFTDEGFYIHNARNLVLFGTERTDEFNNALLMPTLHTVQVGVFRLFGVGAVQARSISVVASLLGLVLFYLALKRAFGMRVAGVGVVFLGLDHVSLLYHRMALMDTPGSLLLIAAFWAFVYALPIGDARVEAQNFARAIFLRLLLCGMLLGVAYATRSLALLLFPVPLLALWRQRRELIAVYGGLGISLTVYAVCWYLPNREEMARVSGYYLNHQLLPHGLVDIKNNIGTALFDVRRGMLPYLLLHTPVMFLLAVGMITSFAPVIKTGSGEPSANRPDGQDAVAPAAHLWDAGSLACVRFLWFWFLIPLVVFCFVSYAPSRYYVLFYPAMAGLAALGVDRLGRLYEAARSHEGHEETRSNAVRGWVAVFALWAVVNGAWLGDWLTHLRYTQRDADLWLANHLPPRSVLVGDAAAGVCLNNRFMAAPVIPGLCNDRQPLERFAPAPRYVVILAGQKNTDWWRERYPRVITETNRLFLPSSHIVDFAVAVYRVDGQQPLPDTLPSR